MNAFCFLTFLAVASAAPQFSHYGHHHGHHPGYHSDYHHEPAPYNAPSSSDFDITEGIFGESVFDTHRFWAEMAAEMHRFDQLMNEFYKRFPATTSQAGVQGNEYVVLITLSGFQEKDIKVKAREGVLMVQAIHKSEDGSEQSYLDLKTLPSYVNVNGSWTFDEGVLKIVFPLNSKPEDSESETTTEAVVQTEAPKEDRDREEMEPDHSVNSNTEGQDADVGIRGDQTKENELLTNVIPRENPVEATTYAVDLKNEVEFVPVKY